MNNKFNSNSNSNSIVVSLRCYFCDKLHRKLSELENHLRSHTEEKPFKCLFPLCPRTFGTSDYRKRHSVVACSYNSRKKKAKGVSCYFCLVPLRNKSTLYFHLRRHTKEHPHKCSQCHLTFSQLTVRSRHVLKVHRKGPQHKCPLCDVVKLTLGELNTHIRKWHTKDNKRFKCYFCNKNIDSAMEYKHIIVHTNEFPELCKYCPANFVTKPSLQYHYFWKHADLVNAEEIRSKFRFTCYFCEEKYFTSYLLGKHLRQHTMERVLKLQLY